MKSRYWHFWISLLMAAGLVPVLRSQHLPLRLDWVTLGIAYWFLLAAQSIFVASLLHFTSVPSAARLEFLRRYRENPLRLVALFLYFAILVWATAGVKALILTVDTAAVLELRERRASHLLRRGASAIFVPAAYLFFGFLMVLAYNCAVVSVRYNFATDPSLAAIDRWLLHGHSVSGLTHWALRVFPLSLFRVSEFIYFGMFPQIGAAMILVALYDGKGRALQLVGTILMSYYLALTIFYLWPAQGPYSICPGHFSHFPASLASYNIQYTLIPHALALYQHEPIPRISTDYFIAFPCMHIVQPLIVLWFLRRWRRMVIVLAVYDVFLVAAVLLLEMHYVIDVIVGVLVAALAIAITAGPLRSKQEEPIPAALEMAG